MQVYVGVCLHGLRPGLPESLNDDVASMIRTCWAKEPEDRPGFDHVVAALKANRQPSMSASSVDDQGSVTSEGGQSSAPSSVPGSPRPERPVKKFRGHRGPDGKMVFHSSPNVVADAEAVDVDVEAGGGAGGGGGEGGGGGVGAGIATDDDTSADVSSLL